MTALVAIFCTALLAVTTWDAFFGWRSWDPKDPNNPNRKWK